MGAEIRIGGLEKLTLLDYPGRTACTIFLTGCNFRCPYCHNASLVLPECIKAREEASKEDHQETFLKKEEIIGFLKKRQGILDGVCVTGGEPLLSPGLFPFLEKLKELGYEVKLDTNGSFPKHLQKAVEKGLVDYVAMDIKNCREKYEKTAGAGGILKQVEQSVDYLLSGVVEYEFRTTAVKGIHEISDFYRIGKFIKGARRYFIQNFLDSGNLVGGMSGCESFSKEELTAFLNEVSPMVKEVSLRGV